MPGTGSNTVRDAEDGAPRQAPAPGGSTTLYAIGLNLLLLGMIAYGYRQSDDLRWAWVLVAIPIAIVTATYIRHWLAR